MEKSKRKYAEIYTINAPDGRLLDVFVYEGESFEEKRIKLEEAFYELARKRPERYHSKKIEGKCPLCGKETLYQCSNEQYISTFCTECDYLNKQGDESYL